MLFILETPNVNISCNNEINKSMIEDTKCNLKKNFHIEQRNNRM